MHERARKLLVKCCEAYVETVFVMALGKPEDMDTMKYSSLPPDNLDGVRVKIHNALETMLGIDFNSEEEKDLNNILHSLQAKISFPLPEKAGYGDVSVTAEELSGNLEEYTKKYGKKLAEHLLDEFQEYCPRCGSVIDPGGKYSEPHCFDCGWYGSDTRGEPSDSEKDENGVKSENGG